MSTSITLERVLKSHFRKNHIAKATPRSDLFAFINGDWIKKTKIPPAEGIWGNFVQLAELNHLRLRDLVDDLTRKKNIKPNTIEQKVRDFYLSGIDVNKAEKTGLSELEKQYNQIDLLSSKSKLIRLVGKLHLIGINPLWRFYIDQDELDSSRYMLRLAQAGLSLPDTDYYLLKNGKIIKLQQKFILHIPKMFKAIKYKNFKVGFSKKIYELEKNLAKHSMNPTERRDVKAQYNKYTYKKLKQSFPHIDWDAYFGGLGTKPPKQLVVDQPNFFRYIDKVLADVPLTELKVYLKWHTLLSGSRYMGERISTANFDFFGKVLYGLKKTKPLWKRVIAVVDGSIGEALGKLYVERYYPPLARKRMEYLVNDLREAFAERIKSLDWMSAKTKQYALKKLGNFQVKIGHPKKFQKYSKLNISANTYMQNAYAAIEHENKRMLAKLDKKVDRDEWWMTPPTVNAYYSFNLNEIVFPAGILQPPFFDFEADDAVNYGGIGYVIGHELTHGFDDQGSQFDASGNMKNWWSKEDRKKFEQRTKVMVRLANKFESMPGEYVKGELTLGENIADLGGAEIAYQAFQKALKRNGPVGPIEGYTQEERFFLNMALVWRQKAREQLRRQRLLSDPHAPGEFRVNNTARNMDAYYQVFNVTSKDKMYLSPNKRVRIW